MIFVALEYEFMTKSGDNVGIAAQSWSSSIMTDILYNIDLYKFSPQVYSGWLIGKLEN